MKRLTLCFIALLALPALAVPLPAVPPVKQPAKRHRPSNHPPLPPTTNSGQTTPGAALTGLTSAQWNDFAQGLEEFQNVETPEGGLGPVFNGVSCVACHFQGAAGGGGGVTVTRFGQLTQGQFNPLTALGGTLLHQNSIDLGIREVIPMVANVIAHRQSTPLFGLGLIEAIADADLIRAAQRPQPDGIQGRVGFITEITTGQTRVGRFGWKNQHATLLGFAADAYLNEMGITSRFFPNDIAPNGNAALLATYDQVADPEDQIDPTTGKSDIDHAADFMRYLAPPPAVPLTPSATAGQQVFQQLNCAACHTPVLMTSAQPVAALSQKPVALYSDLLLHDMGALGDGIVQAPAGAREFRTAPLWGARFSAPYLHDGRAATLDDAIRQHDGEAAPARDRYNRISPQQRQQLLDFLQSI